MSVVWNKDDFLIDLCDENIEDPNSTWDNSEPMDDGRYLVATFFGLDNAKFLQSILAGEIEYPELKEYFDDLASGDYEKWKNGEITETRSGYDIDELCIEKYTNEEEWKQFLTKLLENGVTFGYCCVHFLISLDGKVEIVNNVRVEIENDGTYSRYTVPQQFLDALFEAWLEKAGSEKALFNYLKRGLPENVRLEMNAFDDENAENWDADDFYVDTDYIEDGVFPVDIDKVTDGHSYDVDWTFYISERGQEKLRSLMKNKYTWMSGICGDTCAEYLKEILKPMEVGGCCATFYIWEDGRIELCKTGFDISLTESDRGSMFCAVPDFIMEALKRAFVRCADGLKNLNRIIKDMVDEYRTDTEQLEPLPSIESDSVLDPEEEPVDMMSFIGQAISPSRYRGLTDRSRYVLLDDRFAYIVDGVLICTDDECDIDCDGNICMVWPDGKVLHIGHIRMPESPEINKVKFSRSGNTLKQSCMVWYDNDHHHGDIDEEEIDLTPTDERRRYVEMNYLAADFVETFRGVDRNSFYVESVKAYFQKKGGKDYLILEAKWVKKVPQSFNKHNHWEEVHINLTDGQFEDKDGEEITGGRFFKKLRCKLEEDDGKDARAVFCERFIPTLQKFYPNVKAPLQEGLHPLYMRAMVIKDFLELTATDMVPSKSNELSNYFRDYAWINHYEVRYIMQYTKVAFDFTDAKIAEIYKHIK